MAVLPSAPSCLDPTSKTLLRYAVPKADDLVNFELDRTETPSPVNALGVKGIGEGGR